MNILDNKFFCFFEKNLTKIIEKYEIFWENTHTHTHK